MEHINQAELEDEYWVAYDRIKAKPLPSCLVYLKAYRKPKIFEPIKFRESA